MAFITNVIVFQSQKLSFHSLCHLHFVHFVTVKLFVVSTEPSCGALGVACYLQLWWCFFFRTEVGKWEVHHFPVDVPQTQGAQTQETNNHHHPNHHNHFSRSSLRPALGLRQSLKITTNAMYRCKQGPLNTIRRHKSIRLYNTMQYNALPCNTNPFAKPHFSLGSLDHSSHSSLGLRAPVMHWTSAYKKFQKFHRQEQLK